MTAIRANIGWTHTDRMLGQNGINQQIQNLNRLVTRHDIRANGVLAIRLRIREPVSPKKPNALVADQRHNADRCFESKPGQMRELVQCVECFRLQPLQLSDSRQTVGIR